MDDVYTANEVADGLKIRPDIVLEMVRMGELPGFWIHGEWRVRRNDLEAWLKAISRGQAANPVTSAIERFHNSAQAVDVNSRSVSLQPFRCLLPKESPVDKQVSEQLGVREAVASKARASKTFCTAPWVHFLTLPDGSVLPCCTAKDAVRRDDGTGLNVRQVSPADAWNGPEYRKIRQSLLDGEHISHCVTCYQNESIGRPSYREKFNADYFDETKPDSLSFLDRFLDPLDPLTARKPVFLDIRLGNICNLKCRMCGPGLSSKIEKDEVATAWIGHNPEHRIGANVEDWPEAVNLLSQIKDFSLEAVKLELIGGEPTLNQAHITILKNFVDQGLSQDIDVLMITNMTNTNDLVYRILDQFKNPNVHFSVEAAGAVNDYIRFPAKWSSTSSKLKSAKSKYKNISFGVSPTFQAYNILNITDLFDWCVENEIPFTTGNTLLYPEWLSVRVLPQPVRALAANRIEAWIEAHPDRPEVKTDLLALSSYLRDPTNSATDEDVENFIRYTNDLDVSRGQDIRSSLPELYEAFTAHHPWDHTLFRHRKIADARAVR